MKVGTYISIFVILLCFAAAGVLFFLELRFLSQAETVTGVVKTFRLSEGSEGGSTYCPLIEFITKEGETITFDTRMCSSKKPYEAGEAVKVFYDPQNPQKAQVDDFWSKYLLTTIAFVLGVVFTLFTLLEFVVNSFVKRLRERIAG